MIPASLQFFVTHVGDVRCCTETFSFIFLRCKVSFVAETDVLAIQTLMHTIGGGGI